MLSSTGLLGYVAYRSGVSTILICAAAFYPGLFLAAYPVSAGRRTPTNDSAPYNRLR